MGNLGRETGMARLLILLKEPGGSEHDGFTGGVTLYNMGSLRIVARGTSEVHPASMSCPLACGVERWLAVWMIMHIASLA